MAFYSLFLQISAIMKKLLKRKGSDAMSLFHHRSKAEQFETMAAEYERPIYLLCLRMMGSHEDAQDCAQEALLRAFRAFDHFRQEASPKTWLYRIAYNTCIDELRRRRGVVSLDSLRDDGFDVPDEKATNAYERLAQQERYALLQSAVEKLPEDQRAVLILRDFQQLSYDEMAETLKQPVGTIKSRLNRAREKVKKLIEQAEQNAAASVQRNEGRQK